MGPNKNKEFDYLIVGAGLFGSTFANEAKNHGKSCLIIDKRNHIGGNAYTERIAGINVHKYGAHIFHTNDDEVWNYVTKFADFNRYIHFPIANYRGSLYNLPFNMNTFYQIYGKTSPDQIKSTIFSEPEYISYHSNLEEQAISMVGEKAYRILIKEYTEKQWGKSCNELPSFIIKRIPLRFNFNNNYFNCKHQGIPIGGYTNMIGKMIDGSTLLLGVDYFSDKSYFDSIADKVVYTGMIDKYFGYKHGRLEYRSLSFDTAVIDTPNYQGAACMNFTSNEVPYTRIIEHKHFESLDNRAIYSNNNTVITEEYPSKYDERSEPYYPVNDAKNNSIYEKYREEAIKKKNVIFGGRLGEYKYYDMDQVIRSALNHWK